MKKIFIILCLCSLLVAEKAMATANCSELSDVGNIDACLTDGNTVIGIKTCDWTHGDYRARWITENGTVKCVPTSNLAASGVQSNSPNRCSELSDIGNTAPCLTANNAQIGIKTCDWTHGDYRARWITENNIVKCVVPLCTFWTYSDWSDCTNGQQTRTIVSSQPAGCVGGNPILNQSCNLDPLCTEDNWTSTLISTNCPNNGQQIRKWTKVGQCQGGVSHPSEETIGCNYQAPTCASFIYSNWGICNISGVQTRSVLSSSPSDCIGGNPAISRSCQVEEKKLITKIDKNLSKRISGKVLLQVESRGEAYYVNPDDSKKYYLGRPADAFNVMKKLSLGVTHDFMTSYTEFPDRVSGKILLDVGDGGKAYYIYPKDKKAYYLGRPADAFNVMRNLGLGITNSDLGKIAEGSL